MSLWTPSSPPQQNAAKYYKEYNKAKTAEVMLTQQLEKGRRELDYLNSVLDTIPWRGGKGPSGDPPGAHRHWLSPPPLQVQGPGEACGLQTHGVPLLRRTSHLRGQEQYAE